VSPAPFSTKGERGGKSRNRVAVRKERTDAVPSKKKKSRKGSCHWKKLKGNEVSKKRRGEPAIFPRGGGRTSF